MPKAQVQDDTDFRPPQVDEVPDITSSAQDLFDTPIDHLAPAGYLGDRKQIEAELNMIAASIRTFHLLQPDQILRYCAGFTARLSEMQVLLHRVESTDRQYTRIRTQQVERYIVELDRQWKTASRLIEVMRQDLFMAGGQT